MAHPMNSADTSTPSAHTNGAAATLSGTAPAASAAALLQANSMRSNLTSTAVMTPGQKRRASRSPEQSVEQLGSDAMMAEGSPALGSWIVDSGKKTRNRLDGPQKTALIRMCLKYKSSFQPGQITRWYRFVGDEFNKWLGKKFTNPGRLITKLVATRREQQEKFGNHREENPSSLDQAVDEWIDFLDGFQAQQSASKSLLQNEVRLSDHVHVPGPSRAKRTHTQIEDDSSAHDGESEEEDEMHAERWNQLWSAVQGVLAVERSGHKKATHDHKRSLRRLDGQFETLHKLVEDKIESQSEMQQVMLQNQEKIEAMLRELLTRAQGGIPATHPELE